MDTVVTEANGIIVSFLKLLKEESAKSKSEVFSPAVWQDLLQLEQSLATVEAEPETIAEAILDWCEKYDLLLDGLNQERCDLVEDEDEEIELPAPTWDDNKLENLTLVKNSIKEAVDTHKEKENSDG